jgi:hypothetical protein
MKYRVVVALCLACVFSIVTQAGAAGPLLISEIVPDNARTLADEDGSFPDWIEIYNPTGTPINLLGWHLTDNRAQLGKWTFPSVSLPANGFLVVFASGKNRTNDPAHLHTSFQLEANGEYLALVQPDGVTIASEYDIPAVKEDVSFGLAQTLIASQPIQSTAPQILVPTGPADVPVNWNLASYTPGAAWTTGVAPPAMGFDTNQLSGLPVNVATSGSAAQSTTYQTFTPNLAINNSQGDFSHTLGTDPAPFWQVTLTNQMAIFSVVLYNRTSCCGSRLRDITVEVLTTNESGTITNYASPLLNPENTGFTFPNGPASITLDFVALTGSPVTGRILKVRRAPDPDLSGSAGQGNTDEAAVLSLGEVVINASSAAGLRPYFTTDLKSLMWSNNASAFIRMPFNNFQAPDQVTLRVRYDDGFVAYLNGTEVARRNAPATLDWNSAATADRNLLGASTQETINLSAAIPNIVSGANVFAVQLLNSSANNPDALLQPELTTARVITTPNVYFDSPTPGAANATGWYFSEVKDTKFSIDRGFFEAPFSLEITSETPDAVIYYSFNGDEPGPGKGTLYTGPIVITNTTVVRARAFKDNWKSTDVDSATYLFLADVIRQVPNWEQDRIPPRYFPSSWAPNDIDYGMDPQIVTNFTLAQWKEALTQVPTMSIVTEMRNLFDGTIGIYANASGHGELWERPISLELLDPTNAVVGRFQENCGLRIRGGASRGTGFKKHSFRVFFRREYGAGKLNYPLFEDEGAEEFETFDLRTSQNYSWPRSGDNPTYETMVREVFCRKTLGDMGQPYRRSRYYHLYLNGQYWGLYETDERPEASYGQTYFGGSKTNYDVVKCGNRGVTPTFATEATDGNLVAWSNLWVMTQSMRTNAANSNYFRILGANADGTRNPALPVMIDVDNLIDYMTEIFYSGDGDATLSSFLGNNMPNNWFGMRDRTNPDVGFRFFNSDCEHTLGSPNSQVDRTGPFPNSNEGNFIFSNPQWMHEELMRNLEYRVRFSDHVQKHFFNGGALTLEACTNRFIFKVNQITKAMRAYSARWGDASTPTAPFGESTWTNAIQFVLNWFPLRANIVLNQLIADNLFSTLNAPTFSSYGGFVSPGAQLTITQTNPAGTIYFTTDGSDPRKVGGEIASTAQLYTAPVPIEGNAIVFARVRAGTNWSAIVRAGFTTSAYFRPLAVTEILYNPPGTTNVDGDEFEFLELKNTGTSELNLSGLSFSSGITFAFTNGTRLAPGAFFVLARNPAQFQARYPGVAVNGIYSGRLDNAGEALRLTHVIGGSVFAVTYDDDPPWPLAADGHGFSIVPVNLSTNLNSDNAAHWRASAALGGSPGADDPTPSIPSVVINEVMTHTFAVAQDFIELHNPTASPADVSGWYLTDDKDFPKKFRIPANRIIPAGGYIVFNEAEFNPTPGLGGSFSLNAENDDVYLFSGNAAGDLTGYSHGFSFGAALDGVTFGRYLVSTGEEFFPLQSAATPGQANSGPRVGSVIMSEIHYHPRPGDAAFIELKNITAGPVALYHAAAPTNTWRINGVSFAFPQGTTLPAGGYAIVSEVLPASFRARYNVPAGVPVFGPYGGTLQDSGERLELQQPDAHGTNGYAFVTVDEVRYNDRVPWPTAADGIGPSLQRLNLTTYGNEPLNWRAASPTPGRDFVGGTPPTITQNPANVSVVATREAMFTVGASGPGPLSYQWRFGGTAIAGATNSILNLTGLLLSQSGSYSAVVYNDAGAVESAPATLTVLTPARILQQPVDILVRIRPDPQSAPTTNATFSIVASSTSPIRYAWRFNGALIPDATNSTFTVTNVQLANEGRYAVDITDAAGTIFSGSATLYPMIAPIILQQPVAQTVVVGSKVTLSVLINGNPKPFNYEWRRGSLPLTNYNSTAFQDFFTFDAGDTPSTNLYRVVIRNLANPSPGVPSSTATIITVPDADGDRMADGWETQYGFNPGSAADASLDSDGDGMTNRQEYEAGTDPSDGSSFLKVGLSSSSGAAVISFGAVSNKTYSIQYTDVLGTGWSKLADVIARPVNRVETFTNTPAADRFYRAVTPQQP